MELLFAAQGLYFKTLSINLPVLFKSYHLTYSPSNSLALSSSIMSMEILPAVARYEAASSD